MSQGMQAASRNWKRGKKVSPQDPSKEKRSANTLVLVLKNSFWTSNPQNCKRVSLCCFKLLRFRQLTKAVIRNKYRGLWVTRFKTWANNIGVEI